MAVKNAPMLSDELEDSRRTTAAAMAVLYLVLKLKGETRIPDIKSAKAMLPDGWKVVQEVDYMTGELVLKARP